MLCTPNYVLLAIRATLATFRAWQRSSYLLGAAYPEIDYAGGLPGRYDDPAFEIPECIVVWGKEPLASNPDGLFGHAVIDLMRRGATRLIVVDPRMTWMSSRARLSAAAPSGHRCGACAWPWLNVIISEGPLRPGLCRNTGATASKQLAERVKEMTAGEGRGRSAASFPRRRLSPLPACTQRQAPASIAWGLALDQKAQRHAGGSLHDRFDGYLREHRRSRWYANLAIRTMGLNEAGFGFEEGLGKELIAKMIGAKEYPAYCGFDP